MHHFVIVLSLGDDFQLSKELLERSIIEQKSQGKNVRGFIFCNPNNPLGVIYDKNLMLELMQVCAQHQVHFISDEIYALSVFDQNSRDFQSVLSLDMSEVCNK